MVKSIKNITIVGAGLLGKLIIEKSAIYNYNVCFYDINAAGIDKFLTYIEKRQKENGATSEITFHKDLSEAVKDADLIIESVPENLDLKRQTFSEIDKVAPSHSVIATNSSSIPISKIEDVVSRKEKVLNIHFYNPFTLTMADIMKGTFTDNDTFELGINWIKSLDITPLVVKKECLGFVFNRVWHAIKKDCLKIWAGGHADVDTVDSAWKLFTGKQLGPFEMMDGIGLDVIYDIEMSYYKESGDPSDKPPDQLKMMIDNGLLGVKTEKGFYDWRDREKTHI